MKHENILLKSALALAIVDLVLIAAILTQVNGLVKDIFELQSRQTEVEGMRERLKKAEEIKMPEVKAEKKEGDIKDSLTVDFETGWQVYRNETFGYEIRFPKEFKTEFIDEAIKAPKLKVSSPLQLNEFGLIKDGMQFIIYVSKNVAGYKSPDQFDFNTQVGRDIKLDNHNARQYNFEGIHTLAFPQNTTPFLTSIVGYVDANTVMEIKFGSGGENRYKYLNLFEQILSTFKFID